MKISFAKRTFMTAAIAGAAAFLLIAPTLLHAASAAATNSSPNTSAAAATIGPAKGTLIIVGGGGMPPEIWKRFIDLAGGAKAKIVVIPTANEDAEIARDRTAQKNSFARRERRDGAPHARPQGSR